MVPEGEAESVRRRLIRAGVLRLELKVRRSGRSVLLPVTEPVDLGFPVKTEEFEARDTNIGDYRELLHLADGLMRELPTSFDVIGDVAIIRLPSNLRPHQATIGEAMLRSHPAIRSVAVDSGVQGEFRVRQLEVIAGKGGLETKHREYGLTLYVDPSKAYFSPRLATERHRVAEAVEQDEVVLDMFSGVGPFALMVAKLGRPKRVEAIDANPAAYGYLLKNIAANKVGHVVKPHFGDAAKLAPQLGPARRAIMDLPHGAAAFLPAALSALERGGTIHYYEIMDREAIDDRLEELHRYAKGVGREFEVLRKREVRTYSARDSHFAIDIGA